MKTNLFFKTITAIAIMTFIFTACKKDNLKDCNEHTVSACSEDPSKTNLRITNNSKYDFCNVVVNPSSGQFNCGIIKEGEATCYRSFDTVYNYAYIRLYIGDKEFTLQPIDYVGEPTLGTGKFTYLLDIPDFNTGQISIKVQKD